MKKVLAFLLVALLASTFVLTSRTLAANEVPTQPGILYSSAPNHSPILDSNISPTLPPSPTATPDTLSHNPTRATTPLPAFTPDKAEQPRPFKPRDSITKPATSTPTPMPARVQSPPTSESLRLEAFAQSVQNGQPDQVVGVFVPRVLALRVVPQSSESSAYVYPVAGYATQFKLAARFGTTALLAHNYLAGAQFFQLTPGETANLIYGDGSTRPYVISYTRRFQALRPEDPFSTFVDLDNGHATLSSDQLFRQIYMDAGALVFQTCIASNGISSWGRLFVIAKPQ